MRLPSSRTPTGRQHRQATRVLPAAADRDRAPAARGLALQAVVPAAAEIQKRRASGTTSPTRHTLERTWGLNRWLSGSILWPALGPAASVSKQYAEPPATLHMPADWACNARRAWASISLPAHRRSRPRFRPGLRIRPPARGRSAGTRDDSRLG